MLGALIGDTIGSVYEFHNIKTTEFPLFSTKSTFTDDSVMTMAVAEWLLKGKERTMDDLEDAMVSLARRFPNRGYGVTENVDFAIFLSLSDDARDLCRADV